MRVQILGLILVIVLIASNSPITKGQGSPQPQSQRSRVVGSSSSAPTQDQKPTKNQSEPEPEVVRVDTNLVNTLFTAVDKDRHFITSLRAEDIRIFENEVAQPVSIFERETDRPLALAILIDTSESQVGVLTDEKRAGRAFVDQVIRPKMDQAAIISFTGEPKIEQQLTNDLGKLHRAIEGVTRGLSAENQYRLANDLEPLAKDQDSSGYTGIWDAAWETIANHLAHAPERSRRAVILLSDGDDTSSTIKRQNVIDLAVKNDVVIYSIGIRDDTFPEGKLDSGALKKLSDRTGGRAFFPVQPRELQLAFSQIDQELRSQYLIAYSPTNATHDGSYRRIRIEILNPELRKDKVRLLYREGYYARKNYTGSSCLQAVCATRGSICLEVKMQSEATEYYGRIENGVVVLEKPDELPDGTYVCVTPVKTNSTLGQRLLEFAGTIEGLPPDMASNHDHYIHGTPKK